MDCRLSTFWQRSWLSVMLEAMVRAIFFDFYSVWAPDTIGILLEDAKSLGTNEYANLETMVDHYYHGGVGSDNLAHSLKWKLGRSDVNEDTLKLRASGSLPDVINYMRSLHGHFLKLAIVANLGTSELDFLTEFNTAQSLFEAIVSPLSLGSGEPLLSREVFDPALKAIGEQPNTCIAVSGHDDYLTFAAGLGMQTVKFENMAQFEQTLTQLLQNDTPSYVNPS